LTLFIAPRLQSSGLKLSLTTDERKFHIQCEIHQELGFLIVIGVFAAFDLPDQFRD
jgi:hypothetical protein